MNAELLNTGGNPHAADGLAPVYAQYPIEVVGADGVWLHTRDGRKVLDLYGGHAVASLGYGHQGWTRALADQAAQMNFQTNAVPMEVRARAAQQAARILAPAVRQRVLDQLRRRGQRERLQDGVQDASRAHPRRGGGAEFSRPHRGLRLDHLGRSAEMVLPAARALST